MSVNEKINELRRLNYFIEQDPRDFPNPFLLLSDNQALNKLLIEGQGKPKTGPQVIQGRDDSEAVYDIGAANSRSERARHVREQEAAANAGINRMRSRVNTVARNRADLASLQRMEGIKSLYVREPGQTQHHYDRLGAYDFALPVDSGSEPDTIYSSSSFASSTDSGSEPGTDYSSGSSKKSVPRGRSVAMSREQSQAMDRLPEASRERKGERATRREKSERRVKYLKRSGKKVSDRKEVNDGRADMLDKIARGKGGSATEGDITSAGEKSGAGRKRKTAKNLRGNR